MEKREYRERPDRGERSDRGDRNDRNDRDGGRDDRRQKKKACRFCASKDLKIDYKEAKILQQFLTERGKIVPRRITGLCCAHQKDVTEAIKRARNIAIVGYSSSGY